MNDCFSGNPPTLIDPDRQTTGLSVNQIIQFTSAIELELTLATFGMLEDFLMKNNRKVGRAVVGGECVSIRCLFSSKTGLPIAKSVASSSFFLVPKIT